VAALSTSSPPSAREAILLGETAEKRFAYRIVWKTLRLVTQPHSACLVTFWKELLNIPLHTCHPYLTGRGNQPDQNLACRGWITYWASADHVSDYQHARFYGWTLAVDITNDSLSILCTEIRGNASCCLWTGAAVLDLEFSGRQTQAEGKKCSTHPQNTWKGIKELDEE
jgi:hypothetical protein